MSSLNDQISKAVRELLEGEDEGFPAPHDPDSPGDQYFLAVCGAIPLCEHGNWRAHPYLIRREHHHCPGPEQQQAA